MDKFTIQGPSKMSGSVNVSASKNAALPILAATLLFPYDAQFDNLPKLNDIDAMLELLESHGCITDKKNYKKITVNAEKITNLVADYELVRKMRASILVLGPLLARFGEVKVSLPGGCAIGTRPIDIHLDGLKAMGANIEIKNGYVEAKCEKLKGLKHILPFPSVGATENLMMAATLADGETILENVAREPEIVDLANFLNFHGAKVEGAGTSVIKIQGMTTSQFQKPKTGYNVIGDRIEAATYIIAGLMTKSEVSVQKFDPNHLESVIQTLKNMGAVIEINENGVKVKKSKLNSNIQVDTAPFPGFPTDIQAQLMALATVTPGTMVITENIFENRYMHVPELVRMGADITLKVNVAFVKGVEKLSSAPVMCTDLRASAALVLAALVADGETEIRRVYHIDRGYEEIDKKLASLGVKIERSRQ